MDDSRDEKEERGITEANSKISDIEVEEWYQNLVDDCRTIIVERGFRARMEVIEGYHELGERIETDVNLKKWSNKRGEAIRQLAHDIKLSKESLYSAIQFYNKWPELGNALQSFTEGKEISWFKIVNKYLPETKENETELPTPQYVECPKCHYKFTIN